MAAVKVKTSKRKTKSGKVSVVRSYVRNQKDGTGRTQAERMKYKKEYEEKKKKNRPLQDEWNRKANLQHKFAEETPAPKKSPVKKSKTGMTREQVLKKYAFKKDMSLKGRWKRFKKSICGCKK